MSKTRLKAFLKNSWDVLKLPLGAVLLGLIVGAFAMMWVGFKDGLPTAEVLRLPLKGYGVLLRSNASLYGFGEALVYVVPLILTGLAITFAFRCGLFNIGAEGQFIVGSFAAAYVGFTFNNIPAFLQMILAILAAAVAGGLWGAIAGWLKAKRGMHEVITTIMLNYIAFYGYNILVGDSDFFKASNYQGSLAINPAARLPKIGLFAPSRANWGLLVAILAVVAVYLILWKTKTGFEVRAVGFSSEAARYAGINVARKFVIAMLISGMLAGLAGGVHMLGIQRRAPQLSTFPNFGFDGIAVSLIGQNHPVGVVLSALMFGFMKRGAPGMQAQAGIAKEVVAIVQASIIFFVAADQIVKWIFRRRRQKKGVVSNE